MRRRLFEPAAMLAAVNASTDTDLIVWMDLEMSGLDPNRERILEIATLLTNSELDILAEGPELVIRQPDALLAAMDAWNTEHHTASGLVDRVRASTIDEDEAQRRTVDFLREHCEPGTAPLAGNSVHHDRRFLAAYMPGLEAFLHYRIIDVSSIKELARRWYPRAYASAPAKRETHRALDDIRESIDELRYYRDSIFLRGDDA